MYELSIEANYLPMPCSQINYVSKQGPDREEDSYSIPDICVNIMTPFL